MKQQLSVSLETGYFRPLVFLLMAEIFLSGCASTGQSDPAGSVQAEEGVGFTVTEEVRVGSELQTDYQLALRHLEQGRHEQGVALLEKVADRTPSFSAPRIDLGVEYARAGDLEAARRHLLLALQANPSHPVTHNELGIVYRKLGRFDDARRSYESALEIFSGYHHARRNLAILCDLYLSDMDCALRNYEAYLAAVPEDGDASMWIADIRSRIQQEAN